MTIRLMDDHGVSLRDSVKKLVVEVLGSIQYETGREYPWKANHGSVVQYFKTKHQAVEFARTGLPAE